MRKMPCTTVRMRRQGTYAMVALFRLVLLVSVNANLMVVRKSGISFHTKHSPAQHGAMVKCGARACRAHAQCHACHCGTLLTPQSLHVQPILRRAAPCCALTLRTLLTLLTLLRCPGLQARGVVYCFDGAALCCAVA